MTGIDGARTGVQDHRDAERIFWDQNGITSTEHFVRVGPDRTRLRVQEVGSGEPVLFVHGTGGSAAYFAPLMRELNGFRCLAVDRPGWGLSEPADFAAHDYTTLVVQLLRDSLDELGLAQVRVVGGSIGNNWALRLAQARPDRVTRMVWLGGFALNELRVPMPIRMLASPLGRVVARMGHKERVIRKQLAAAGHCRTLDSGRMDDYLAWRMAQAREVPVLRNERNMIRCMRDRHGWVPGVAAEDGDLCGIGQPTLLVYGTNDPVGSVDLWPKKIEQMPRGELAVVDGAGHMPWYDDPSGVGARVRQFLTAEL